jgi:flagellar basal-body rod modification protein FlgD
MANVDFNALQNLGLTQQEKINTAKKEGDLGQGDFLKLMVTQLNNQDPLEPMDNGAFLGQIAQFSTVTGLEDLQTSFSDFASSLSSDQALQASSLIGRSVYAPLNEGVLSEVGTIDGELTLPASSGDVSVRITDASGQLIKTISLGTQAAGPVLFGWDGMLENGQRAPAGTYVVNAQARIDGQNFELDTNLLAEVDSVTLASAGKGLQLNLSGLGSVSFSDVSRIQ